MCVPQKHTYVPDCKDVCPGLLIFFNIYRILKCPLSVDIKHLSLETRQLDNVVEQFFRS